MAWRDAILSRDPLSFEQGKFGEAHEDGIEGAGFQARFAAKFVAVTPGGGMPDEALQDAQSLRRQAGTLHQIILHI